MNLVKTANRKISYDHRNYFKAKVIGIPIYLESRKTIKVSHRKKIFVSKYHRYKYKDYRYMVHFEPKAEGCNPNLSLGDVIKVYPCRKLSAHKAMVTLGWI